MFPIGTILYVVDAGMGARGANNTLVKVTDEISENGIYSYDEGFNISIIKPSLLAKKRKIWRVNNDGKYTVYPHDNLELINEWFDSINLINSLQESDNMI